MLNRREALAAFPTLLMAGAVAAQEVAAPQEEEKKKKAEKKKKDKEREWQTGKILSAEPKDAGTFGYPMFWPMMYRTKYVWLYTIDTERLVYELLWPLSTPLNVTLKGQVRFAVAKKQTVYVMDDDGEERRLTLFRKIAK